MAGRRDVDRRRDPEGRGQGQGHRDLIDPQPAWRPTREQIRAAAGRTVPDVIAPALRVLFCGINPGLYSGAVGHHFARPGNRFWRTLHLAGFTDRLLSPFEERVLLEHALGVTNLVERATAAASELTEDELRAGARALAAKIERYRPRALACLGVSTFRIAFDRPDAKIGRHSERIHDSVVWVVPNPSGLNAHYQLPDLAREFAALRKAAG